METATRLVTVVGAIITVMGLTWLLSGASDYLSGRKNGNPQQMDQGMNSMISGGALAAIAGSVATAIVTAMNNIHF